MSLDEFLWTPDRISRVDFAPEGSACVVVEVDGDEKVLMLSRECLFNLQAAFSCSPCGSSEYPILPWGRVN